MANVELRIPLFGTSRLGLIEFPYLPTELSLFADGGLAWSADAEPVLEFARNSDERVPVFSSGIAARINILGALITQFYWAHPFQRPGKDSVFGFVVAAGW